MPSIRSVRLRFLALALVAAGAACSVHQSGGALPASQALMRVAKAPPAPIVHAPCTIPSGFVAPLIGKLDVVTAFGQLTRINGIRSATQGVDFGTTAERNVRAAQSGHLKYIDDSVYAKSALITVKGGAQTFYGPLADGKSAKLPPPRNIKAGEVLGKTANKTLHFEMTTSAGRAQGAAAQLNPCGSSEGSTGTISLLPAAADVDIIFTSLALDNTPLPSPPPGAELNPATLTVAQVMTKHSYSYAFFEYGPTEGSYYVVLCGNVVFRTGHARYAGPIPFSGGTPPPPLIFFRDPGPVSDDAGELTDPLPATYPRPCPAPASPSGNANGWVFNAVGQTVYGFWLGTPGTMSMTVANSTIVVVSPSPAPIVSATPAYPPAPGTFYTITASAIGSTQISNVSSNGDSPSPITVTVRATPVAASIPTPVPNTLPSTSPTPKATATPTPAS